ncbi:uncharacterized protein LOC111245510 isoform X3 [Varroa destructor]|uniref:Uncharacterized protein n=1 Tax=Varroa destructor TaxID=109461 RepID=A0A7M7JCQ2_VARDE|nr:uncharacterized protein LOC111245510 isoform X3 [Varroa destructor]
MSSGGSNPLFATVGEARNNMRDLRTIHEEVRESYDPSRESHTRERPLLRSTGNATGSIGGPHHAPLIHTSRGSRGSREESREYSLFDVAAPSAGRVIFDHNQSTFRLVNTVADFTQQLSQLHEQYAEDLQLLVEAFRKRNIELKKERPAYTSSLFNCWEILLQEVEVDSQVHGDIARSLSQNVGVILLEKTFFRKIQSRKIFLHRESFETILTKAEELLAKCHDNYSIAYAAFAQSRSPQKLAEYYDAHNLYVQQLHATNGMIEQYYSVTLPKLLEELEEVYCDLSNTISSSILSATELLACKVQEQQDHYSVVGSACRNVNSRADLANFVRTLSVERGAGQHVRHQYQTPKDLHDTDPSQPLDSYHTLGDQVIVDRLAQLQLPARAEALRNDLHTLDVQVRQLQEALDSLSRLQQRSIESNLFNKANELQEDMCLKRFDLQVAQIHQAAVRAQLELFRGKLDGFPALDYTMAGQNAASQHSSAQGQTTLRNPQQQDANSFRDGRVASGVGSAKSSSAGNTGSGSIYGSQLATLQAAAAAFQQNASGGTIKNKWLKAFRSLKTGGNSGASDKLESGNDKKAKMTPFESGQHILQEYTYKKVAACDVCREILRGHVRQGLKCKLCKINVHAECQDKVPRCQPKPRLLRRQRSTSEIESRIAVPVDNEDEKLAMSNGECGPGIGSIVTGAFGGFGPTGGAIRGVGRGGGLSVDPIYQLLKQAAEVGSSGAGSSRLKEGNAMSSGSNLGLLPSGQRSDNLQTRRPRSNASSTSSSSHMLTVSPHAPHHSSSSALADRRRQIVSAPHSPQRKRLNLRMKSLSLDSPDANGDPQHRRRQQHPSHPGHHGPPTSHGGSHSQSPQSPVTNRRQFLSAKTVRMSSVDLPDDNEKSLSSASTSPCPSPKAHRLLPTNIYVVLYGFRSRQTDELDLKPGDTVTVIDTSDPDWWQGKCMGKVGFFPSKYVAKLHPGERALQVVHPIQVAEQPGLGGPDNPGGPGGSSAKLVRDQLTKFRGQYIISIPF